MPYGDVKKLIFDGDMRYLEIGLAAYVANRWLNKDNDNAEETLPAGLRISYADISFALAGDPATEGAGSTNAQFDTVRQLEGEIVVRPEGQSRPYGANALDSNVDPVTQVIRTSDQSNTLPRDEVSIRNAALDAQARELGQDPNMTQAQKQARIDAARANWLTTEGTGEGQYGSAECQDYYRSTNKSENPSPKESACLDALSNHLSLGELGDAQKDGAQTIRDKFKDALLYGSIDAMLWKLDHNVYRGFAWDLIKGDGATKLKALGTYVLNGVENGHLFGFQFNSIADAGEWLSSINYLTRIALNQANAVDNFLADKTVFNFFESKFNEFINNALNFSLPNGTLAAIFIGIKTGYWGLNGNGAAFNDGGYIGGNGQFKSSPYQTLGKVALDATLKVVFKWADKTLGMPAGTAYEVYKMYKDIQTAATLAKNYQVFSLLLDANPAWTAQQFIDAGQGIAYAAYAANLAKLKEIADTGNGSVHALGYTWSAEQIKGLNPEELNILADGMQQEKNIQALNAAKAAIVTYVVMAIINKVFGESMANLDKSLGLVPGTTAMVVGVAVGVGVGLAFGVAPNPYLIAVQLLIIIGMNLFGVYKFDVYCDADGFYPEGDISRVQWRSPYGPTGLFGLSISPSSTSSNPADEAALANAPNATGLGIWDGTNIDTHRQKTIEAARTRARQLVGDILLMHNSPRYRDVIPSQIMTGRQEDVNFWATAADENICKLIGDNYYFDKAGGCRTGTVENPGTAVRAGLWANPQVTAFTHIGF